MLMENEEIKDYKVKKSVGIATKSFAKILVASVAPLVAGPLSVVPTVAGTVAEIAVKKSQEKKNDYKNKSYKRPFSKD